MSNLFNLPFSFSSNPQSLKSLLQHRKNIPLNSSEDKWSEKAIKGLIKRLTKSSMLDDLLFALDGQNIHSRCVTIPRLEWFFFAFVSDKIVLRFQRCPKETGRTESINNLS